MKLALLIPLAVVCYWTGGHCAQLVLRRRGQWPNTIGGWFIGAAGLAAAVLLLMIMDRL